MVNQAFDYEPSFDALIFIVQYLAPRAIHWILFGLLKEWEALLNVTISVSESGLCPTAER